MYDWAHGQCDYIEQVSHSLCSLEFKPHRDLYEWFVGNDAFNDKISDTIDYVDLARIAKREMLTRSKLLEAVVKRIIDRSFEEINVLNKISVTVSKLNPPINADVEAVLVTMEEER